MTLLLVFLIFSASFADDIPDATCQLPTRNGWTLQENINLTCDRNCTCTSSFESAFADFFNGSVPAWRPMLRIDYEVMETTPAGNWYVHAPIRDSHGDMCVLLDPRQIISPCPWGFSCAGGRKSPYGCLYGEHCPGGTKMLNGRAPLCPKNKYCIVPAIDPQICGNGLQCPEGSQLPRACSSGYYCANGSKTRCPRDHFCPPASEIPKKCNALYYCPEGSRNPDKRPLIMALMLLFGSTVSAATRYYQRIIHRGVVVCLLCAGIIAMMWWADSLIGGFLSLIYLSAAANWMVLRMPCLPIWMASVSFCLTMVLALLALWLIHPPWCLTVGWLVFLTFIGWLMSRESLAAEVTGRLLFLGCFGLLIYAYEQIDHVVLVIAGSCVGLLCLGLLVFGGFADCRDWSTRKAVAQAVLGDTVRDVLAVGEGSSPGQGLASVREVRRTEPARNEQASSEPAPSEPDLNQHQDIERAGTEPTSTTSAFDMEAASGAGGVSFCLKDVGFELPDGKQVLTNVSFEIAAGRQVALMGPSGCGKSTLLAVLSGRASHGKVTGEIIVSGQQASGMRFLRRVTGFVPQDDVLHGELTVHQNIYFQAALRLPAGTKQDQIEKQVEDVASNMLLTEIMDERVGTQEKRGVSGGQRKRVSIAMELVSKPKLLFADEPTSGLDSTMSHDVMKCLKTAAHNIGTTVIAVIHQPRYDTLNLFNDLILLAAIQGKSGGLAYAGETHSAKVYFESNLSVKFELNVNPADKFLDAIQSNEANVHCPEKVVAIWRESAGHVTRSSARVDTKVNRSDFSRGRPPLIQSVLLYMHRSLLQTLEARHVVLFNQFLCVFSVFMLCLMMKYETLDNFAMQSSFACLFLMLLQGVAAQRVFGPDLLVTWREARVGMPMISYFIAKDLAALFEVTISAFIFSLTYGAFSGLQMELHTLFAGSWAFIFCVYGLNYIVSITLSAGSAQMTAVVSSFLFFTVAGLNAPYLPDFAKQLDGRAWMIPALSPIRWFWAFLITAETPYNIGSEVAKQAVSRELLHKGYDVSVLGFCRDRSRTTAYTNFQGAWSHNDGWVCTTSEMLLLGVMFRYLAAICLMMYVHAHTSGWARFIGQSERLAWRMIGRIFQGLLFCFLALVIFALIWSFGLFRLPGWFPDPLEHLRNWLKQYYDMHPGLEASTSHMHPEIGASTAWLLTE